VRGSVTRRTAIRELAGTVRSLAQCSATSGGLATYQSQISEGVEALAQIAADPERQAINRARCAVDEVRAVRETLKGVEQARDQAIRDAKAAQAEVELLRKALAPFAYGKTRAGKRAKAAMDRTAPIPF
jgi:hypothetical protein